MVPFTLITGRATTGKSGLVTKAILEAAGEGRPAVLLLPSFAETRRAHDEIAAKVPVGVVVATIDQWAESVWAVHGNGRRLISGLERFTLLEEIVQDQRLTLPTSLSMRTVWANLLARTAGEEIREAGGRVERQLSSLLHEYRRRVEESGRIERSEVYLALAATTAIAGATVAAHRFTDLSRAQERFLVGLSESNDVLVALTWEQGHAATEALDPLVRRLSGVACSVVHVEAAPPSDELKRLERDLFGAAGPQEPQGRVLLAEAVGGEAEAALVAEQVAEAVGQGVDPARIAVAFRDLSSRAVLLAAAFESRGLSADFDLALPLGRAPFGRSLFSLLDVALGRGARTELLAYLHGPHCDAQTAAVEHLDAQWRGRREDRPERMLREAGGLSQRAERAVSAARSFADGTGARSADALRDLADELLEAGCDQDRPHLDIRLDGAAYRSVLEACSRAKALPKPATPFALRDWLGQASLTTGSRDEPGSVYVTEAHRLRSRRFDVVVLGGLTADEFSSDGPEPVIADLLRRLGVHPGTEQRLSERLLFYSVATRARSRLVLVRKAADERGEALRPSVFWDEVRDLYRTSRQASLGEEGSLRTCARLSGADVARAAPAFRVGRLEQRERAVSGGLVAPANIRGAEPQDLGVGQCDEMSVTELEAYHRCPYQWFFQRLVRPRVLDAEFEARERGTLAHGLMAAFYSEWIARGRGRVEPETLPEALELADELARAAASGPRHERPRGIAEELAEASVHRWVRAAIEQDATRLEAFAPVAHEYEFGESAGRPFELAGVRLRGRVDRVDVGHDGLVVTDYKSSSSVSGHRSFEGKAMLQVPVYMAVLSHLLDVPAVGGLYRSLGTGLMRGIWDSERSKPEAWISARDAVSSDEVERCIEWSLTQAAAAASGIRAGRIAPEPRTKESCTWCSAKPLCGRAG